MNPRIVKGRPGSETAFAARAHVDDTAFALGVDRDAAKHYSRLSLEDHLLAEAASLMARVADATDFDWEVHGFVHNPEFEVWEKTLSIDELESLMG